MGGGGEAPPVKGEDVIILIGASILLVTLILHAWVTPTKLHSTENSDGEIKYDYYVISHDMSAGDIFEIEVISGSVMIEMKFGNDGDYMVEEVSNSDKWDFTADESGEYFFNISDVFDDVPQEPNVLGEDPSKYSSEFTTSISRGLVLDWIMYPIGIIVLGFGMAKKYYPSDDESNQNDLDDSKEEAIEALLED